MTTCIKCLNLTRHGEKMARMGFGNCKLKTEWTYLSTVKDRDCVDFSQAPEQTVKLRSDWMGKGK